jgi:hypothetical protein
VSLCLPLQERRHSLCKVRGITLNYKNSLTINFDAIKDMVINNRDDVKTVRDDFKLTRDHKRLLIVHQDKDYSTWAYVKTNKSYTSNFYLYVCSVQRNQLSEFWLFCSIAVMICVLMSAITGETTFLKYVLRKGEQCALQSLVILIQEKKDVFYEMSTT